MNLEYISLLLDNSSIVNGFGNPVPVSDTVLIWSRDLKKFQEYLSAGTFPNGYTLTVPDFWHITHGQAKCLPKVEADELWDSTIEARTAAEPYIESRELVLQPHPGTKLYFKSIVPYEAEGKIK